MAAGRERKGRSGQHSVAQDDSHTPMAIKPNKEKGAGPEGAWPGRCSRSGPAPAAPQCPRRTGMEECGPLLTWLQTFAPPSPSASPQDLARTLAHALHCIDPSWFNERWLSRIREDAEGVSNLRKVLQSILEYWQDVLGQAVGEQHIPDLALVAEDPEELGKLVRLVLGCAVSCERREEQIQRIRSLEESVQHAVMRAIQELLEEEPSGPAVPYGSFDTQSRRYYFLSQEPEELGGTQQRVVQLEQQVAVLQEERGSLAEENRVLREAELGGARRLRLLQEEVEQLREENSRLESGQEELAARCRQLEREARGLQARAEELRGLEGETQALREEVETLRASSARAGRLEVAVSALRGRAVAAGELRRELEEGRELRERRLRERLEREREGLGAVRREVEELRALRARAVREEQRWREELRGLREELRALGQEKERLQEERDSLREANEELRCAQEQQLCLQQAGAQTPPGQNLAAEILPAELRETVSRLRRENRRLQEREVMLRLQRDQLRQRLRLETPRLAELRGEGEPPEEVLRNQLREKEVLIRQLENNREQLRAQREREERLLITAWDSMGLSVPQQTSDGGGLSRGGGAESFLAQQRLATVARRSRPPHGRPPNR